MCAPFGAWAARTLHRYFSVKPLPNMDTTAHERAADLAVRRNIEAHVRLQSVIGALYHSYRANGAKHR